MLDLFGDYRRKTIKDIYNELNEMLLTNEGNWKKTTFTSEDGLMSFTSYVKTFDLPQSTNDTTNVKNLESELDVAVEEQNFEKAAKLRDKISKLKSLT